MASSTERNVTCGICGEDDENCASCLMCVRAGDMCRTCHQQWVNISGNDPLECHVCKQQSLQNSTATACVRDDATQEIYDIAGQLQQYISRIVSDGDNDGDNDYLIFTRATTRPWGSPLLTVPQLDARLGLSR